MSTVLAQAQIILTADTARFTQEIVNARNLSVNSFDEIRQSAKEMAKVGMMGVVAGATAATTAIAAMTVEQVKLANELSKTALVANTTVTAIQKYTFAAKAAGIEQDKLADIFKDTQDKVGDFLSTGGGELQDFFKNVAPQAHLTADALRRLSGPEALQAMYDAMEKAKLSQSEMVFYMEGIADEASSLIPLLRDGGAGFKLWANAAENAGAVMDEKTIRASKELKASTDLLKLSYEGVKNQLTQALIPVLSDLAVKLTNDVTLKDNARKAGDSLATGLKGLALAGLSVVATFDLVGSSLGGFLGMVGQLGNNVDWNSPYAMFQVGKNFWANNQEAAKVGMVALDDIKTKLAQYKSFAEQIQKLGTTGPNATISSYVKLNDAIDQNNIKLGKTGAQIQEQLEKEKELAKEREKSVKSLEKIQARLVGISGNSGIGSGAHLDIRVSGGSRRLTSAELARFQADGKPLTAYRKTSDYGYRGDIGVAGASKYHRGIDLAMPVGTPITTKVPVKNVSNFYDSKGGGYVQRILFADGLSVDLLHQSPASKGIKGGSSGINTPYAKAQDESAQLIAQQQSEAARVADQQTREAKRIEDEQKALNKKLVYEYANDRTKAWLEHLDKIEEIGKSKDKSLREAAEKSENARYQNKLDLIQLEYDKQTQKATEWQQTDAERIHANAELERREAALTLTNDTKMRQAKIDAINQAEQAALQNARDSFKAEISSINDYAMSESDKIYLKYKDLIDKLDRRTDIDPSQKSDMRNAYGGAKNYELHNVRKAALDAFNGLGADLNGTQAYFQLDQSYQSQLEIVKKYEKEHTDEVEKAEAMRAKIQENYAVAKTQLMLADLTQTANSFADMGKIMFGETSSSYKRLFALSQSFVMAQAGLNMYKAISDGWAQGATLPQKLAAASVAAAEMLKIITAAQQIKMQGFMDGGYTGNIPTNARAGYVHGQEYVFDAPSTKAIGVKNLERIRKGEGIGGDTNVNVNVTVNSDGTSSVESQQQLGKNMGDAMAAVALKVVKGELGQNGMIYKEIRRR
ncbi:hypothetical protein [Moraxella osloensis]|uniref:hypothetical protein n=1 Tax=Faucicola osloensis TaxID=34062 RepID=UPI0020036E62|nr:hypothetical protein [Moraxella osloensis]MCK6052516.1 hypothetical protein [Moraxella osloensis]